MLTIGAWVLKCIQIYVIGRKMSIIKFKFNQSKAVEVILYLVQNLPIHNVYRVCKLLYLADKISLEKYGRFIFGESYTAMEGGGTPSNVYNMIKDIKVNPTDDLKVDGNNILSFRDADLDYLSESDIECLDAVVSKYGNDWTSMKDDAHDGAWEDSWNKRGVKKSHPIPTENIAKMLPDSEELIDYLSNIG